MRIRTDGDYEHRQKVIEETADLFDCNKTKAVLIACEHAQQDARQKRDAMEWAAATLEPNQAAKLAGILNGLHISTEYQPPEGRSNARSHPE